MKAFISHVRELLKKNGERKMALVWLLWDIGAWLVFGVSTSAVCGYVIRAEFLYKGWVMYSPSMSLQTAISLSVIGVLLLTLHRIK